MQEMKFMRKDHFSDLQRKSLKKQLSSIVTAEAFDMKLSVGNMSREIYGDFLSIFSDYGNQKKAAKGGSLYGRKRK